MKKYKKLPYYTFSMMTDSRLDWIRREVEQYDFENNLEVAIDDLIKCFENCRKIAWRKYKSVEMLEAEVKLLKEKVRELEGIEACNLNPILIRQLTLLIEERDALEEQNLKLAKRLEERRTRLRAVGK